MKHERAANQAQSYVKALERALADHPASQRATIIEDVRAHIADSLEAGHSLEHVLQGLGSPSSVASTAAAEMREDSARAQDAASPVGWARRLLLIAAAAVGVLTAAVVSFLLPVYQTVTVSMDPDSGESERVESAVTLVELAGFAAVLLALVPVVFAALPLLLPARMRAGFTLAGAIAVTIFTIIGAASLGAFFLPLALLLWAAVITPGTIRRGPGRIAGRVWRALGAIVVALPALAMIAGLTSGVFDASLAPVAWAVLACVLALLFGLGLPLGHVLVTGVGGILMVLAVIDAGMLFLAFWIAGGVYLTIGLIAWVADTATRLRGNPPGART